MKVFIKHLKIAILAGISVFSAIGVSLGNPNYGKDEILNLYYSIDFAGAEKVEFQLFAQAMNGFHLLEDSKKLSSKKIITLIDFRKSGNEKRMWVIDLENKKVLFHSLVAHGRNTGDVYASKFSNRHESNQSSLGFFITGATYTGKHGLSLKLHGIEPGINDQAEARAIVMHGADYVSDSYIKKVGRLGRSFGCPAIPMEMHEEIINKLTEGTCLFLYYPDHVYLSTTRFKDDTHSTESQMIQGGN